MALEIDDELLKYATPAQERVLKAVIKTGGRNAAAKEIGCASSHVTRVVRAVEKKAARLGYAPGHFSDGTAPGFHMGKVTIQRGPGGVERVWERQSPDLEALRGAREDALEALKEELPRSRPIEPPAEEVDAALCNLLTLTDFHLGMLAWHREGGDNWNVEQAERTARAATEALLRQAPKADTLVINVQGDFLHTDGKLPLTPASKHVLDADSRFPKIRKAAIRLIRMMVDRGLETHREVHLIIAEGNHDEEGSGWLADAFTVIYENEPRIEVNDSALPFYVFEWGQAMIGVHHGHKVKNESLPLLFAAQFPEVWGRTKKREIHCGHRHHRDEKEYNGVTVIQHPTLAARDAHAARGGWIADRAAQLITYHRQFGHVGRVVVCPEMLQGEEVEQWPPNAA